MTLVIATAVATVVCLVFALVSHIGIMWLVVLFFLGYTVYDYYCYRSGVMARPSPDALRRAILGAGLEEKWVNVDFMTGTRFPLTADGRDSIRNGIFVIGSTYYIVYSFNLAIVGKISDIEILGTDCKRYDGGHNVRYKCCIAFSDDGTVYRVYTRSRAVRDDIINLIWKRQGV